MKAQIRLSEVIWEITDCCQNGCKYCGSKDILNQTDIVRRNIYKIARELASVRSLKEVNFSGGDPFMIKPDTYDELMGLFRTDVKFKIVCNALSYEKLGEERIFGVLDRMNVIGVSVNTPEEMFAAKEMVEKYRATHKANEAKPITIITNFSLSNIFDFEDIERFVIGGYFGWQVQFTIDEQMGLYTSDKATRELFVKLNDHFEKYDRTGKTFVADNMSSGPCGAATMGMGVLANGDVVPCLSMRSYYDEMPVVGNLIHGDIKEIWEQGFSEFRCKDFVCCKDICKYAFNNSKEKVLTKIDNPVIVDPYVPPIFVPTDNDFPNMVVMYGVQTGGTMVYAVQEIPRYPKIDTGSMKFVYGVRDILEPFSKGDDDDGSSKS